MMTPFSPSSFGVVLDHLLDGEADDVQRADEVDLDDPVEELQRHRPLFREDLSRIGHAGAVDRHVDLPEGGHDLFHGRPARLVARHVGLDEKAVRPQLGGDLLAPLHRDIQNRHLGPQGGQAPGGRLPQTRGAPGDYRNDILDLHRHSPFFSLDFVPLSCLILNIFSRVKTEASPLMPAGGTPRDTFRGPDQGNSTKEDRLTPSRSWNDVDPHREHLCLTVLGKLLQVRMPLEQFLQDGGFFFPVVDAPEDAAHGERPNVLPFPIQVIFPGIDEEAYGAVALEVPVFFCRRQGDHIEFPAVVVGHVGHERTVGLPVRDGRQDTQVVPFDDFLYLFLHRGLPLSSADSTGFPG